MASTLAGTTTDGTKFTTTNVIYLDFAIANLGALATVGRFNIVLWVDGVLNKTWFVDQGVAPNTFLSLQDYPLPPMVAGSHAFRLTLDSGGALAESNETDNEFSKTILIVDDDPDDQISGAFGLGVVEKTLSRSGALDSSTDVDMVSFAVLSGQRLSFDIDGSTGWDPYIRLFDDSGVELASNNDATGPGELASAESYLEYTFKDAGAYYLGITC